MRRASEGAARMVAAVLSVLLVAGGCVASGDSTSRETGSRTDIDGTADSVSHDAVPAELQGTWLIDLSRAQIRNDMAEAGFGRYFDRFIRAEGLGRRTRMAVTYREDSFEIAWRRPHNVWYVGWYGTAHERGGVVTLTDAESHASDAYAWSRDGTHLRLRWKSTTTPDQHGIPFEAYSRAYFSRPLRRGDCTPADLTACWQG